MRRNLTQHHPAKWFGILLALSLFIFNFTYANTPLNQIKVKPDQGKVVLTFDDGPNPKYTPEIINILNHYKIHAVFFVMGGFAKKYPNLIKLIHDSGNVIANHTMTHPKLTKISPSQYSYQILTVNKMINEEVGVRLLCVRPPFGLSNQQVREFIRSHGMQVIMWDVNSFDYNRPGVEKIIKAVVSTAKSGDDILMHDGPQSRSQTVKALPHIIEGLEKKGLGFDVIC